MPIVRVISNEGPPAPPRRSRERPRPHAPPPSRATMSAIAPGPFPWRSLESTTRTEVAALHDARRWLAQHVHVDAFASELQALVGAPVRVLVRRVVLAGRSPPLTCLPGLPALEGAVGLVLGRTDDAPQGAARLEVERALAVAVVARVLRRPLPAVVDPTASRAATLAGALAAVVVAAARRAHADVPLRVLSAGADLAGHARTDAAGDGVCLSLTVIVGDDAFESRLTLSADATFGAPPAAWTQRALSSLGALPLALPIVACATLARAADLSALQRGDVWLPGSWPLELARDGTGPSGSLRGPVLLAAPASPAGVRARLLDQNRLVLSGEVDMLCRAEAEMSELEGESALLDAVGDVPVVVRVEVGEARMVAREWAALGRGDIVTLGRRVGDRVVLRVGGMPVARGELVSVDGEVGVRIVERLAGDATTT
jgi:flagellar motor switch/type III secretory pathway protein FliN